ncbi:IS110 family transposase [Vibrio fortis]|uniref:IS110 family transposase n=1 Tax=Vibrio fortis TaxID=212667 RepID=UPI0021C3EA45|nr:transposase [Vibrio fortis]
MSDYSYFCGIDLAKNHFSLHAVDQNGKVILNKSVTRSKLLTKIANMPLMRIGVEACGGAHYWARTLNKLGHDARVMAVKYVIPYRTKGKNDLNDAVTIYKVVQRPSTRFVLIKSPEQQAILSVHRMREHWVRERTALMNRMRALLSEFGLLVHGARSVIANLGDKQDKLSQWCRGVLERRGMNRAIVALAAKNARIIWSLLYNQTEYENYAA